MQKVLTIAIDSNSFKKCCTIVAQFFYLCNELFKYIYYGFENRLFHPL